VNDQARNAKQAIRGHALALGFDAVGFTTADGDPENETALARFFAKGLHGDMDWMAETQARRAAPDALWPEAKSIITVGVNYGPRDDPLAPLARRDRGVVSVYAKGRDYHDVVKKNLRELARWTAENWDCEVKLFVDTAPVMEKPLAMRAGMGWQGKHTNLVSTEFGSWLFLGEIFTTLDMAPDDAHPDHCGTCDKCLRACPTGALPEPYRIDPKRCISYLTIEHKGDIPEDLRKGMGNRIYGCDDCLAVCPWNKFAKPAREPAFLPRPELTAPRLSDLVQLDDGAFRTVFSGSPIKRTGRDRFVRNVLIAIGNSGDCGLVLSARARLDDPSPLVREAARWAVVRLETAQNTTPNSVPGA